MTWVELLRLEMGAAYSTTERLLEKVDGTRLEWKPETGGNWMTMGQLLRHIGEACGAGCRAFMTGDWGLPPGVRVEDLTPEEMLPPAEKLPTIESLEMARKMLAEDRAIAFQMIEEAGEAGLNGREMAAPWSPGVKRVLGWHMLQMVNHLDRHKGQLFYYLKLQGVAVNTEDLWGKA